MGELSFSPAAFTGGKMEAKMIGNFTLPELSGTAWSGTLSEPAGNFDMLAVSCDGVISGNTAKHWVRFRIGATSVGFEFLLCPLNEEVANASVILVKTPNKQKFVGCSFFNNSDVTSSAAHFSFADAGITDSIVSSATNLKAGMHMKITGIKF